MYVHTRVQVFAFATFCIYIPIQYTQIQTYTQGINMCVRIFIY